jgi:hypothetical protein
VCAGAGAQAATFYARADATSGTYNQTDSRTFENFTVNDLESTANGTNTSSTFASAEADASASGNVGTSNALGSASVNTTTGEIKVSTRNDPTGQAVNASATADGEIKENLTLNGTGTLTVSMAIDVDWDIFGLNGNDPFWDFQATVCISTTCDRFRLGSNAPTDPSLSGSVDDLILEVSVDYSNAVGTGTNISFYILAGQYAWAGGSIDASKTGTLFYETTGDLLATPSDSTFLSEAVFPDDIADGSGGTGVVPLPGSMTLMLGSLGIIGLAARRRRGGQAGRRT